MSSSSGAGSPVWPARPTSRPTVGTSSFWNEPPWPPGHQGATPGSSSIRSIRSWSQGSALMLMAVAPRGVVLVEHRIPTSSSSIPMVPHRAGRGNGHLARRAAGSSPSASERGWRGVDHRLRSHRAAWDRPRRPAGGNDVLRCERPPRVVHGDGVGDRDDRARAGIAVGRPRPWSQSHPPAALVDTIHQGIGCLKHPL